LGKIVAVHAESEPMTGKLATEALAQGRITVRDYLDSRPVAAELEAISRAIELAGETGCALHVVHVSSGAGVMLVKAGRERGVDVTCETCPHYLTLIAEDMEKLGAVAKCAPPLREKAVAESLWQLVRESKVNTIGSDHSPAPPDMKVDENFFKVWGGISGIQHTLPLLITEGCVKRNVDLWLIERLTSSAVANRFSLSDKGRIGIGWDADFALVDLKAEFTVRAEDLFYRHKQSPYVGRALTGRVVRTILRGQTIFRDGKIVSRPAGKFVEPTRR
jgi:allantoinase